MGTKVAFTVLEAGIHGAAARTASEEACANCTWSKKAANGASKSPPASVPARRCRPMWGACAAKDIYA